MVSSEGRALNPTLLEWQVSKIRPKFKVVSLTDAAAIQQRLLGFPQVADYMMVT